MIEKHRDPEDARSYFLYVTQIGKEKMNELNSRSDEQIYSLIQQLTEADQSMLVRNMTFIENILTNGKQIRPEDIAIREDIRVGDAGYIIYMHGRIYSQDDTAIAMYTKAGFVKITEKKNNSWREDLTELEFETQL